MALTPSNMMPLGTIAPDFSLTDVVSGKTVHLYENGSFKATVVMFICNHCPFVKHVNAELVALANDYIPKGISFIAINANDAINYPQDGPDEMKRTAVQLGYPFPYLYDETQDVAKSYDAACTPDFFIFDGNLKCAYRGQLDDSRPSNDLPVTGKDIRAVLDQLIKGETVTVDQKPSIGCNIKWKE